ncbi:MAG: hypothetical protein E7022_00920 [Desulfovibrio desulfuricans]|nr:hypothetical protein [Desulfovibrio desulfuricans]
MATTINNDFASELVLNRIMNGQIKSDTGKTVTAAGRVMASRLDATAFANSVTAANVSSGLTFAQGAQDALTELVSKVKKLQELASGAVSDEEARAYSTSLKTDIDAILNTKIDGKSVLGTAAGGGTLPSVNLGLGSSSLNVGIDVNASGTKFNALYALLGQTGFTRAVATPGDAADAITDAINELNAAIATVGSQYDTMNNRYQMLNDLNETYHAASDMQAVTAGGSASSLLSRIL